MKKQRRSTLAKKGELIRRQVCGNAKVDREYGTADEFRMMFNDVTDEFCWGTVWARPGLDRKTRAMLSLAMCAVQCQAGGVHAHTKTCLRHGWSKREIGEILLHTYVYAGVFASSFSFLVAGEAIAEYEAELKAAKRGTKSPH